MAYLFSVHTTAVQIALSMYWECIGQGCPAQLCAYGIYEPLGMKLLSKPINFIRNTITQTDFLKRKARTHNKKIGRTISSERSADLRIVGMVLFDSRFCFGVREHNIQF